MTKPQLQAIWAPNPGPQTEFLASTAREVLYGGAVGGGKSDALVVAPLRWAYHPKHRAILLRRERDDLQEIVDRMRDIYPQVIPGARWVETRNRFELPTGAKIHIGFAERAEDIMAFKSFEFNWVGFDELTLWLQSQYLYMLSRNRSKDEALPLQMRAGTNPDGEGHEWVYSRFVENRLPYQIYSTRQRFRDTSTGRVRQVESTQQFIPSTVFDNPKLANRDEYIAGLRAMGPHLADALIYGKWDFFRGQMFPYGPTGGLVEVEPGLKSNDYYLVRALDYGWTDPTVVQWWVVYPKLEPRPGAGPVTELVAEIHEAEASIATLASRIKTMEILLASRDGLSFPVRQSVADPSIKKSEGTSQGRSVLDLFQDQGLWFERANNDRQAGWAQCRNQLEFQRARVWRGRGQWLLATLPKLVRDTNKAEDIKAKQQDHDADTFRYAQVTVRDMPVAQAREEEPKPNQDQVFDKLVALHQERSQSNFLAGDPMDYL